MNNMQKIHDAALTTVRFVAFCGAFDMLRLLLAPEIEKELGRKMTDEEWYRHLRKSFEQMSMEERLSLN